VPEEGWWGYDRGAGETAPRHQGKGNKPGGTIRTLENRRGVKGRHKKVRRPGRNGKRGTKFLKEWVRRKHSRGYRKQKHFHTGGRNPKNKLSNEQSQVKKKSTQKRDHSLTTGHAKGSGRRKANSHLVALTQLGVSSQGTYYERRCGLKIEGQKQN